MARTKGLAKKGTVHSSSSSPKTPPDLNHTPPSSPELSLSPSLSQIPNILDISPLNMIENFAHEEEEITTVKPKPKPRQKKSMSSQSVNRRRSQIGMSMGIRGYG